MGHSRDRPTDRRAYRKNAPRESRVSVPGLPVVGVDRHASWWTEREGMARQLRHLSGNGVGAVCGDTRQAVVPIWWTTERNGNDVTKGPVALEPDATEIPGLPKLGIDPPTETMPVLPGPQPEPADEGKPKRRRKRKVKPEPAPVPDGVSEQDLANCQDALAKTFLVASAVVAKKRGDHWKLEEKEADSLGEVWTAALAPYLPKIGAAVPWATALVVTGVMVVPRIKRDRELGNVDRPELVR